MTDGTGHQTLVWAPSTAADLSGYQVYQFTPDPSRDDSFTLVAEISGSAVADVGPVKASGFLAWLFWLFLHIFWLIGFRNRLAVMSEWAWAYFSLQRRVRLITGLRGAATTEGAPPLARR